MADKEGAERPSFDQFRRRQNEGKPVVFVPQDALVVGKLSQMAISSYFQTSVAFAVCWKLSSTYGLAPAESVRHRPLCLRLESTSSSLTVSPAQCTFLPRGSCQ